MRKLFALMIGLGVFVGFFSEEITLMANVYLGDPKMHTVQEGESLSEIAYRYYGNAYYWRELALINMAPDPDLIVTGEEIFVPSRQAILKLNNAETISTVKNVIIVQETALNRSKDQDEAPSLTTPKPKEQPTPSDDEIAEDKTTPAPSAEEEQSQQQAEESSFPWIWVIAGGLIVTGVLGLVFYSRRRKRLQGEKRNKDLEPVHKTMKPQRRDQEVSSAQRQAHEGNGKKKEKEKREPAHADY